MLREKAPNRNTLITESTTGRLFEVAPDKEIVWEYLNPQRGGENNELVPIVTGGLRFSAESLTFLPYNKQTSAQSRG